MRFPIVSFSAASLILVTTAPVLLALPQGASPAAASASNVQRALSIEDYYRITSVGSVEISPNGEWVRYSLSTPNEANNGSVSGGSWVVRTDGSMPPERVTHQGANPSGLGWGSNSQLLFNFQNATWSLDPARLAAPATPSPQPPNRAAGLSPDGRTIARAQSLPAPTRPAPPQLTEFEQRHQERFRGDMFDWYPFRQDGQRFPLPERRAQAPSEVFLLQPSGNAAPRQLTRIGLQVGSVQWVPDGSAIVFTANNNFLDEITYGYTDLFRVTPNGDLTRLTDDQYNYSNLGFSPDGRHMLYTRSVSTDMIISQKLDNGGSQDIFITPAGGGEPVNVTAKWDLDPDAIRWSPDSRFVYFTAETGGSVHLFRVSPIGGGVEQVTTGQRRLGSITFDNNFRRIAYTIANFDRPADIYVADIDGRNERRLTDIHADFLSGVSLSTRAPETVKWKSYDGTEIEGFLIFPHNYSATGGSYPLIIMNHGGPHAASGYGFNFKNALFAAHGYFVFLPNFRSSTGYGDAFKWATWGGWGNKDGEDVLSGVDFLISQYPVDRSRVGSTGHSYGGIITNWLITKYPDRFRAAIPGAGESNWTSNFALSDISRTKETEFFGTPWDPRAREIMIAQSPALNCGGTKAATLFVHGAVDYRVPLEGAIQLYTCLKKQKVPTQMIIYEGQSHGISGHWNNVHRMMHELRWWETYLKPVVPVVGG